MTELPRPRRTTSSTPCHWVVINKTACPWCDPVITCGSSLVDLDPLLCELVSFDTIIVAVLVNFISNLLELCLHLLLL